MIGNEYSYNTIQQKDTYCLYNNTKNGYFNIRDSFIEFSEIKAYVFYDYAGVTRALNSLSIIYPHKFEIRKILYEYEDVDVLPKTYLLSDLVLDEIAIKYNVLHGSINFVSLLKHYNPNHNFLVFYDCTTNHSIIAFRRFLESYFSPAIKIKTNKKQIFCVYSDNLEKINNLPKHFGHHTPNILNINTIEWL